MGTDRRPGRAALALGCLPFAWGVACASPVTVPVEPVHGGVFSYYSAPLQTDFDATPVGSKVGKSDLFFFQLPVNGSRIPVATFADASIAHAAERAGIQTIHYADYQVIDVLGIFVRLEVRVSGD